MLNGRAPFLGDVQDSPAFSSASLLHMEHTLNKSALIEREGVPSDPSLEKEMPSKSSSLSHILLMV